MTPPIPAGGELLYTDAQSAAFSWYNALAEKPKQSITSNRTPRKTVQFAAACILHAAGIHPPLVLPPGLLEDLEALPDLQVPQQPDIDWQPNFQKYSERVQRNKARRRNGSGQLPEGYPREISSPLVWTGAELREDQYIFHLTEAEIMEVEKAMKDFKASNLRKSAIDRDTFSLPLLGPRITEISRQLDNGCGFFILRGFDPKKYSSEENVILYAGVASYVADKRGRQDEHGNMLLHLVDLGSKVAPDNVRQAPYSNVAQPFHTDLGEILGLYALDQATRGGRSKLASTGKVYNELAALRPDHIDILQRPDWVFDRFGQSPPYLTRPLLYCDNETNNITLAFSRRLLTGSKVSPRSKGIPPMTEDQAEALDAVHFTAEKHCISLELQRGDMQFWNNLALLHAREGFKDDLEKGKRRHLLRLWLRRKESPWKSPAPLRELLEDVYGNIQSQAGIEEKWPIEPIMDYDHVTTRRRSSGHG
ncbi:hypothetical protein BDZ91DRAFT_174561 [Kalaharituber pfeilii]|nr:hypothetical protein BDZ91DRAFT_174561 [Kalaharituber pfeilii]